ncbi:MAG: iron-sulfur cluster repair di-iron protein [Planctomycetota bacterium]|nr:MAG: iron-sulfur cluster repair di-iron protein [Planctomycetota bacterium]
MVTIDVRSTVGELVARHPALSRVFEEAGVDYCCGGKKPLADACEQNGLDPAAFVVKLQQAADTADAGQFVDAAAMLLTELADHIEQTHHAYLKAELPRIDFLTAKVSSVHGDHDGRLREIRRITVQFIDELSAHMMKEERVLFPMIRQLESGSSPLAFHCGSIGNPIRQMELEHHGAGDALEQLRALSDGYTPPDWACNTYRAMLDALSRLERDMHQHVHKEDNVLFPRALAREAQLATQGAC